MRGPSVRRSKVLSRAVRGKKWCLGRSSEFLRQCLDFGAHCDQWIYTDSFFSGDLSHDERLDYVNAVLCLQSLPPRTPANVSAGARSRVRCCWTERDWIIEDIFDFLIGSLTISL